MRDERLEKIRFILPAYYTNLNDDVKDDFEDEVDRTSVKTKLNMLQTKSKFLIRIAKYDKKLNEFVTRYPLLELVSRHDLLWRDFAFYCTLTMNVTMLLSYNMLRTEVECDPENEDLEPPCYEYSKKGDRPMLMGIFYNWKRPTAALEQDLIDITHLAFLCVGLFQGMCS
jgi:hypothetical protein